MKPPVHIADFGKKPQEYGDLSIGPSSSTLSFVPSSWPGKPTKPRRLQVAHIEDYSFDQGWVDDYDTILVEEYENKPKLIVDKYRVRGKERILIDSVLIDLEKYFND